MCFVYDTFRFVDQVRFNRFVVNKGKIGKFLRRIGQVFLTSCIVMAAIGQHNLLRVVDHLFMNRHAHGMDIHTAFIVFAAVLIIPN